jgi:sugar lactone lactonase YvrE
LIDGVGNLYIADRTNNRIRKIDTNGAITTVAGNGTSGFSGDGGIATSASLNAPNGLATDNVGNLYIADTNNNRIRKVDTSGIITTIAGNGTIGFGGDGGMAVAANLSAPNEVAIDGVGNLYIADTNNNRIRKIDGGGVITTVAGSGTTGFGGDGGLAVNASLNTPSGIAIDSGGNLYIADTNNSRIREVNGTGIISTIAGNGTSGFNGDGGPAIAASLSIPVEIALDSAGNLYITDANNNRIRKVDNSGIISTVAGNGTVGFGGDGGNAVNANLNFPNGIATDSTGNVYIADTNNNRIREVNNSGVINTIAGNGGVSSELLGIDITSGQIAETLHLNDLLILIGSE